MYAVRASYVCQIVIRHIPSTVSMYLTLGSNITQITLQHYDFYNFDTHFPSLFRGFIFLYFGHITPHVIF